MSAFRNLVQSLYAGVVGFSVIALMLSGACFWFAPSPLSLFLVLVFAAIAWVLARFYRGAQRANGTGTAFFGHTPTPHGYVATKWVSLFHIPLLPVESCEILHTEPGSSLYYFVGNQESTTFYYRPVPLATSQVLRIGWIPICLLVIPPVLLIAFGSTVAG
jgi:hypothetical protein